MLSTKDRSASRNYNQSFDLTNSNSMGGGGDLNSSRVSQLNNTNTQPLGFLASLQQSIFGSSNSNTSQNKHQNAGNKSFADSQSQNLQMPLCIVPGKSAHVQIFCDILYKNSTRVMLTDETTASEVIKNLKQKYSVVAGVSHTNTGVPGHHHTSSNILNSSNISSSGSTNKISSSFISGGMSNINEKQLSASTLQSSSQQDQQRKLLQSKSQRNDSFKDEYGLFLVNNKALNPMLFVRRLSPNDQVLRVYMKALDSFRKKEEKTGSFSININNNQGGLGAYSQSSGRFTLIFAKNADIEQLIINKQTSIDTNSKSKGSQQFDAEIHVVSQLGKSIKYNKTYERKGKLYKKSVNSDKFKERQFVLDKDQLFYYKNEKQKEQNFNLIMLSNATICIINYQKQKYCFEIENDNRKYILATKSQYDLDQWVYAIQGQIRLSRDNKNIQDVNQTITIREKEIASHDMALIQKIFKPKNVIFNPVQPILLDFINDPFINELLPNLTKYMTLVREKDYQRHALDKAKDIVLQLKTLQKKLQKSLYQQSNTLKVTHQQQLLEQQKKRNPNNQNNNDGDQYIEEEEDSISVQLQKVASQQVAQIEGGGIMSDDYKRYRELRPEEKIQQIFSREDFETIEGEYQKIIGESSQDPNKPLIMNPRLFNNILLKINRIIKYNYLEEFLQQRKVELLSIPTQNFKINMTKMEFNATGQNLVNRGNKNVNIFESMLIKKGFVNGKLVGGVQNIDQNFQSQLKNFIGTIQQDQRSQNQQPVGEDRISNLSAITKITNNEQFQSIKQQ